jgi:hypothetical protein
VQKHDGLFHRLLGCIQRLRKRCAGPKECQEQLSAELRQYCADAGIKFTDEAWGWVVM